MVDLVNRTTFWVGFWSIFGIGNYIASRYHQSLCETVREDFRMETSGGMFAFSASFIVGMAVLFRHVRKPYLRR